MNSLMPLSAVAWSLTGMFALLVFATAASAVIARLNPHRDYMELRLRIRTWWLIAIVFVIVVPFSRTAAVIALAFVSFVALREFLALAEMRTADRGAAAWLYLAVPLQYLWAWLGWYGAFLLFVPLCMLPAVATRLVLTGETQGFVRAAAVLQWGLMTTVFGLSHLAFLLALPQPEGASYNGVTLLFFVVFLTEFNDVAQYVWGKCCGRRQAIARVSPNKTCEGLIGGVATTTLVAWLIAPWLTPLDTFESIAAGWLIGTAGFAGDIVMSAIKRDVGVKDTANLLPGHGGALDRLDSLIFTAPLFFHFLTLQHYPS